MDANIKLPFSVQSMDLKRWMSWVTEEETKLFVKLLADNGGKEIVCSSQFFGEDEFYFLSHLMASGAFRKDIVLPSETSFFPFLKLC
jgi:hypothetical protein